MRPTPYEPCWLSTLGLSRDAGPRSGRGGADPIFHSVFEAGMWISGADPDFTMLDVKPGQPRDLHVLPGGNVAKPREEAPRGFPTVLAKGEASFRHGSGRLELAERIFTDATLSASRVMVNQSLGLALRQAAGRHSERFRHAGRPAVASAASRRPRGRLRRAWLVAEVAAPRDHAFGNLPPGEPATARCGPDRPGQSPPLADESAPSRHRGLSRLHPAGDRRPRRQARRPARRPRPVDEPPPHRLWPHQSRSHDLAAAALRLPRADDAQPRTGDDHDAAAAIVRTEQSLHEGPGGRPVRGVAKEPDPNSRLRVHRKVLGREPSDREFALAEAFLATGSMADYAHALLSTNEVIFWP